MAEPDLRLIPSPAKAVLGEMYPVEIELSWQGASDLYSSIPPTLALSDWAEVASVKSIATTLGDTHLIRHTLEIRPLKTGEFTISDIMVSYFTPNNDVSPSDVDSEVVVYPTLSAGILNVLVVESSDSMLFNMGLSALCVLILGIVWGMKRKNRLQLANTPEYRQFTVPVMLHEAQKRRLDGNYYHFYQELLRGAGLLKDSPVKKQLQERYQELTLAVGYKGKTPSEEELDGAMRELHQAHAQEQGTKPE